MASRFWAGSSSESESGSESEVSDVEEVKTAVNRWEVDSDSESEDDVRVVKSAKDKALETIERACVQIKNFTKINDWTKIQTEFDVMCKQLDNAKAKQAIQAHGYPKFYIRCMGELEDALNSKLKNKVEQKKMAKENSKALIRMKGKVKKHNETIVKQLEEFRANPESFESEEEAESDESDDSEESDEDSDASDEEETASDKDSDESDEDSENKSGTSENEVRLHAMQSSFIHIVHLIHPFELFGMCYASSLGLPSTSMDELPLNYIHLLYELFLFEVVVL